jgi:lysophospholipase L1-like esterase
VKILLAGDSTVANYVATSTPMSGWGAHLGAPLNARLTRQLITSGRLDDDPMIIPVLDVAKNGATTDSFRAGQLWAALLEQAEPGDGVLLQFGHNDAKRPELEPDGRYRDNLRQFVAEAGAAGCWSVLCTPVMRRQAPAEWPELTDRHHRYADAVRGLAAELDLSLIDLTGATGRLIEELGPEGSRALFTQYAAGEHPLYPDGIEDNTHFCFAGAARVADLVAEQLAPMIMSRLRAE